MVRSPKARVLVVDDQAINRTISSGTLRASDYDVDVAEDGETAVRAATTTAYDLILMDINLPGVDGYTATSRIRSQETASKSSKIVALSTQAEASLRSNAPRVGMDGFIARPIGPAALVERVARFLAESNAAREAPVVWDRTEYASLARRLGADRMRNFLADLTMRLDALVVGLADGTISPATIPSRVHDLRSIAGMLGFMELLSTCSTLQTSHQDSSPHDQIAVLTRASRRAIDAMSVVLVPPSAGPASAG